MIAPPCAVHVPLPKVPAHVEVIRDGRRRARSSIRFLQMGDRVLVHRGARFTISYSGNRYHVPYGQFRLRCQNVSVSGRRRAPQKTVLALALQSGRIEVRSGPHARSALVLTRELLAFAPARRTTFIVGRYPPAGRSRAWTLGQRIVVARRSHERMRVNVRRINSRLTYTAISDAKGLRLDVWPFSVSPLQRPTTAADRLVPFWADGLSCSVGCTAPGAIPGWPLKPFHHQHVIRAGINELRPANFHVAVDIEARTSQPVYAIQSGYASIRYQGTGDVNVDVGRFFYWHINPTVSNGQYVVAYKTIIGRVLYGFNHVALSEGTTSDYLNPLRPGGSLHPYTDTEPPVIGTPRIFSDGRVIVGAFDPQSFVSIRRMPYETPVLAPSSVAWRLYNRRGRALTGLEWAMRGSQNYPPGLKGVIFAPGAANPGFECFFKRQRCIPNWVYWLAGGLTERLPLSSLRRGRYRLTVYAWDWAGNTSALDYWFKVPLVHAAASAPEFGPLNPQFDYDETGARVAPPAAPGSRP